MILLTGVNGFIGRCLVEKILQVYQSNEIVVLSSTNHSCLRTIIYSEGLYSMNKELEQNEFLDDIEYIIHAGAFTPKSGASAYDLAGTQNNILNSTYLFSLPFKRLKKIIFLSTLDVYKIVGIVDENTLTLPETLYGWSKLYSEEILKNLCKINNIDYQIFRIGHVYGPGEEAYQKIIPLTFQRILENKNVEIYGTGNELRNFIYVEDVVLAIVASLCQNFKNNIINVVGEGSISIKTIISLMLKVSSSKSLVRHTNLDFKGKDYCFDNSLFVENCKPSYTPLEEGLLKEWEYLNK